MSKQAAKKSEASKAPQTTDIKRELAKVSLDKIRIPAENPARAGCDATVVENYTGIITDHIDELKEHKGSEPVPKFPLSPPKVKRIEPDEQGHEFEAICGCHTLKAATEAGLETIPVEICEGSDEDLLIEAIQDNAKHGLQYTSKDIRHNILNLKKTSKEMTTRKIAEIVGCSKSKVANVLGEGNEKGGKKEKRQVKPYDRKEFFAGLLKTVEKKIDEYDDVDMIELGKLTGRIFKVVDEKRPGLREYYREALQAVLDPETAGLVDYESDSLYDEVKRKEFEALQLADNPKKKPTRQLKDAG